MARIDITKLSSKGQVVIPVEMRRNLKEGDKLIVIESGNRLILKKADKFDKNLKEEIEFAKRNEEAYKKIDAGEYISVDADNLFEEMDK